MNNSNPNDIIISLLILYILFKITKWILKKIIKFLKSYSSFKDKELYENYSKKNNENISNFVPYKIKNILTKNEYQFYKELKKITDKKSLIICPKVGLKDLFEVTNEKNYMTYFGRIAQKHIDFLICNNDLTPEYAIELDDKSHENSDRVKGDDFKNDLFQNNNIKLYRIKAKMEYSEDYISNYLNINESINSNDLKNEEKWIYEDKKNDQSIETERPIKKESIWFKKIF